MNRHMLIDAIVRQTMVLIARLATTGGKRISLAHLANQIFLDLTTELKASNLGSKVIADMFGLTLRAYHTKKKRLSETQTERGKSLWEGVVSFLSSGGTISRKKILERFHVGDHPMVTGILNDLVESGIVFRSGRGPSMMYRVVATDDTLGTTAQQEEGIAAFLWTLIYRLGPISAVSLCRHLPTVEADTIQRVLKQLDESGRIEVKDQDGTAVYASSEVLLELEDKEGWEASVFDHFQAVANVIAASAEQAQSPVRSDLIGGSTFHFDLAEEHPMRDEVVEFIARVRTEGSALRRKVDEYNREYSRDLEKSFRILFYLGKNLLLEETSSEDE